MRPNSHAAETEEKAQRILVQVGSFDAACRMAVVGLSIAIPPRASGYALGARSMSD